MRRCARDRRIRGHKHGPIGALVRLAVGLTCAIPAIASAGPPSLPPTTGQARIDQGVQVQRPGQPAPETAAPGPAAPEVQRPSSMTPPPAAETPAESEPPQPTQPTQPQSEAVEAPTPDGPSPQPDAVGPAPTDAPATATPRPTKSAIAASSPTGLKKKHKLLDDRFPHRGWIMEFDIGTIGCVRTVCGSNRHDAKPGVRLHGFLGGNIRGWVELGISGGWGTMGSDVKNVNAFALYGFDPNLLQQAIAAQTGTPLRINLPTLTVTGAKFRTAQAGPLLRVHFIPRGRLAAYVGTGVGYHLFRALYDTTTGPLRLDFHGLNVPIQAGLGVHLHKNISVGAQFEYLWTWYGLSAVDHPTQRAAIPLGVLQDAAATTGISPDLNGELPQFWNLSLAIRARL